MDFAFVVLVGGRGTRVSKLLKGKSKPELNITKKKKIIDFQLEKLSKYKKKIFFLSNSRFLSLKKYLKNRYSKLIDYELIEEINELGTAGALKNLQKENYKNFIIIDGDLLFNIDFKNFFKFHRIKKSDCSLLVHPNNHPYDSDAVRVDDKYKITKIYNKKNKVKPNLCLSGIKILSKKSLNYVHKNKFQDFTNDLLPNLFRNKIKLFAYHTREYVKDIGTPERIKKAKQEIKTLKYKNGSLINSIPAIFMDKDGVINILDKKKHYQNIKNIYKNSIKALEKINNSKYLAIVITNQPAIAKGMITKQKFKEDLIYLSTKLGSKRVYYDRLYYCPHHPKKGFKNEIPYLKIKCNCRKPKNGLFLRAIKELNIDVKKSFMIGDQLSDYEAAKKSKIKFLGINIKSKKNQNIITKKNLLSAVNYIINFKI